MQSREEIFELLKKLMAEMFDVERDDIKLESNLYEDLDIDSIDAVDLVVELRAITSKQIDPEEFKAVRTVEDVVTAVARIVGLQ